MLHVTVVDRPDQAPLPPIVEARTAVGKPISIPIPVIGADPDGDVVSLVGVSSAPTHGTLPPVDKDGNVVDANGRQVRATSGNGKGDLIKVPANSIYYQPATAGSDEFTYTVRDPDGLEGRGTVRIAVIPATTSSPPVAVPDHLVAIPGKTLEANVVANDSSPDGNDIKLVDVPDLRKVSPRGLLEVRPDTGVLVVRVSGKPGDKMAFPYRITDTLGQTADSTLTIDVVASTTGAPPVAVDDILAPAKPGAQVIASILENDSDPDGLVSALTVTNDAPPALHASWNGVNLSFRMPNAPVQFRYTLRDKDGNTASAFVIVPLALTTSLQTKPVAVTVEPGKSVPIDVVANDLPAGDVELDGFTKPPTSGTVTQAGGKAIYTAATDGTATVDGFSYKVHQRSNPTKTAEGVVTITIVRKGNHAPSLSGLELQVPAGGSASINDLNQSVSDPDVGDHFTFQLVGGTDTAKVHPQLNGSKLTVSADKDAYSVTKGVVAPLQLKVTDSGSPPMSAEAQVHIVLQPTTSPPPVVSNDTYQVQRKDGPKPLNVLANDIGSHLKIDSVSQPPSGQGTAAPQGDTVLYTPPSDTAGSFTGTTSFTYRVADDSGEESHKVTGTVTINVIGKPDAPGKPSGDTGSKQVTLRWAAPNANGAPISRYEVHDDGTGFNQGCDSTTCTLTSLTNGTTYRFKVRAYNTFAGAETPGDWSPPSDDLKPDKRPDPPTFGAPTAGDKELTVAWTDAASLRGHRHPGLQGIDQPGGRCAGEPGPRRRRAHRHLHRVEERHRLPGDPDRTQRGR